VLVETTRLVRSDLHRFVVLYAAMYAGYGVASPFLPAFVTAHGVSPRELGFVLGTATATRLVSAPLVGRAADRLHALHIVLAFTSVAGAAATLGFLSAHSFKTFLLIATLQVAALAPMTVLADALAIRSRFEYGWVRGTGSAAFIAGTLVSGQVIAASTLDAIVWMQAALLALASGAALFVPEIPHPSERKPLELRRLLEVPSFPWIVVAAALVLGSHAMHDAFAVIRWNAAGIGPGASSALWSEAVAAEVLVFFFIGPRLLPLLTPAGAIAAAALAGVVRWSVMATSTDVVALALLQPLHGFTFALLHLASMRLIAQSVPPGLEGTAQAFYGTGAGAMNAALTIASGALYGRLGPRAFWIMAALCGAALPVAARLRSARRDR
jgi:PPP family 3-phenylpropionic acid transporter